MVYIGSQRDVQGNDAVPLILDQRVAQSELVIVNMDNLKDVENIDHALSIIEYEPQKIHAKKRRNSGEYTLFHHLILRYSRLKINTVILFPDSALSSSQTTGISLPDNTYYEVPRTVQPKKATVTPQYYSKPSHETAKTPETVQTVKTRDIQYIYPILSPGRQTRQRSPSARQTLNPPSALPIVEAKLENILPSRTKKPRQFVASTTPSSDYSTKTTRRRKSRKRAEKTSSQDAAPENSNNYPVTDTPKGHTVLTNEGRGKHRRLVAKYDVVPRPFVRSQTTKENQEGSLEKLTDEGAVSGRSREANDRNYPNAPKSNGGESNGYTKSIAPVGSPISSLNRKLYQRKNTRQRPTDVASKVSPVTPSGLDIYQNIEPSVVTIHSNSPSSTSLPHVSPVSHASDLVFYPSAVSTLAPVLDFEASSVNPWIPGRLSQPKQRDVGEVKEKVDGEVDGVAQATSFGSDEGGSKGNGGKYETYETPNEDHYSQNDGQHSQEYSQQEQSSNGNSGDSRNSQDAYSGESKDDVRGEGTHVSLHKGQGDVKENAGDGGDAGGKGSGGDDEFEEGGKEEKQEGHEKTEGQKEKKGYKSRHEHEKANKGHHDKERQNNYYEEKDGKEKEHNEEGGYLEEHQQGEESEKKTEFDEKGEHQKGYSTKGEHSVHKKDEFEKRTEFFDEFNEDSETENDGEFYQDHKMTKGGSEKMSHHDNEDNVDKYGKESKYEKGKQYHEDKGHKTSEGQGKYHDHKTMHGEKKDNQQGKNWSYKNGDDGSADRHSTKELRDGKVFSSERRTACGGIHEEIQFVMDLMWNDAITDEYSLLKRYPTIRHPQVS
ncbi:hypothetical protein WN55_09025 [Dufourea novaeangliae]|uniref:Uncharacterized protein n=1 Tax=Dufourea novaeangliae TaxID=178035 RepID=A0A154P7V5_DUFNO|nr:hypothetical protein WN55_09025 [Dufourea novaeangliae]